MNYFLFVLLTVNLFNCVKAFCLLLYDTIDIFVLLPVKCTTEMTEFFVFSGVCMTICSNCIADLILCF